MGYKSFIVDFTNEACEECVGDYQNKVFDIDDVDNLPPHHPNCMCVAIFSPLSPEDYADQNGYDFDGFGSDEETPEETPESQEETQETTEEQPEEPEVPADEGHSMSTDDLQNLISSVSSLLTPDDLIGVDSELADDEDLAKSPDGTLNNAVLTNSMKSYLADPQGYAAANPGRSNTILNMIHQMLH